MSICGTVARMVTLKGSMLTEGETVQVTVLPYRCLIWPFCCVCLVCCAAEFGSSGGSYELPCILCEEEQLSVMKIWISQQLWSKELTILNRNKICETVRYLVTSVSKIRFVMEYSICFKCVAVSNYRKINLTVYNLTVVDRGTDRGTGMTSTEGTICNLKITLKKV
jgi:hypothetical protein